MVVDCHVHFRDFKQKHKETIKHGLEVARDSGVSGTFTMPNTDPPIMTEKEVVDYITIAREANVPEVFFGIYMGLTKNKEQIKRAVEIVRKYFPIVVGMKMYLGHSVGDLGITDVDDEYTVVETLAQEGYLGVLAEHAEKEKKLYPQIWNPQFPVSHCLARPSEAEVESVKDAIMITKTAGFKGKTHIAHISSPQAVELVKNAKKEGMDISCGVCPHHLIYDWNQMFKKDGVLWKMNPPLRAPGDPHMMVEHLRNGDIDWIETDHAPHTLTEKLAHPYMSGIPGLPWWPLYTEFLRSKGFSEKKIYEVTHENITKRFGIDIPINKIPIKDRRADYSFNPYTDLEQLLQYKI